MWLRSGRSIRQVPFMKEDNRKLKIALVHDYLQWHGGAEKVLEVLHEIWPEAPVYTSVYNSRTMPDLYKSWDIRASFMQRLPGWGKLLKQYSLLYPLAFVICLIFVIG